MSGVLDAGQAMTAQRAELVAVANAVEARSRDPLDVACRPGGYYLSSAGIPIDCEGRTIPQNEWKPEDRARLLGKEVAPDNEGKAPVRADGADVVEQSGSEKRTAGRQAPRRGV